MIYALIKKKIVSVFSKNNAQHMQLKKKYINYKRLLFKYTSNSKF